MLNNGNYCGEITNKWQENELPYCSANIESDTVDPQINQSPKIARIQAGCAVRSAVEN